MWDTQINEVKAGADLDDDTETDTDVNGITLNKIIPLSFTVQDSCGTRFVGLLVHAILQ